MTNAEVYRGFHDDKKVEEHYLIGNMPASKSIHLGAKLNHQHEPALRMKYDSLQSREALPFYLWRWSGNRSC